MKHSIQTAACFTTFAISTGAQNFLETTKSEKFSEMTNYSIIPTKPTKSDSKKIKSCSPDQTTKSKTYEILSFVNFVNFGFWIRWARQIIFQDFTNEIEDPWWDWCAVFALCSVLSVCLIVGLLFIVTKFFSPLKGPSMFFYPNFIFILSWLYPNFTEIKYG